MTVRWGAVAQRGNPMRSHALLVMCTWEISARAVTPTNIEMAIVPMMTSVFWALRAFGGLKAGTPLAIASTPVSAVHPDEKARSVRKISARPPREPYPDVTFTP